MSFHLISGKTRKTPDDLKVRPAETTPLDNQPTVDVYGRLDLTLPFPPSVNHYWRHVGHKTLISRAGREYREQVAHRCLAVRGLLGGFLSVSIRAVFPDRRRRDVDNLLKATLDALAYAGVYDDDSQIKQLTIQHVDTRKPGWLRVSIEPKIRED